jgi:hypothetical protein
MAGTYTQAVSDLDNATKELNEAFQGVKEDLGRVFVAFEDLRSAGPTDDVHAVLEALEDVVRDVRTGGFVGSGAHRHRRARQRWLEAGGRPG